MAAKKVVLSGGEFGGTEVNASELTKGKIVMNDDAGGKWTYDLAVSSDEAKAEFTGYDPAK